MIRQRRMRQSPDLAVVAWLALPVIAFTWEWTEVAPHYMIPLMPAAYILCGAGLETLRRAVQGPRLRRVVLAGGGILVLVIAGGQVYLLAELLRFLDGHATPGGFGTPLHYLMEVRNAVLDQDPDSVIVISEEERAPYEEEPAVWGVLLEPVPDVRFVNGTQTAVIPSGGALELMAWSPALRICQEQACINQVGARVFERRPGEYPYILRPAEPPVWAVNVTGIEPVRFANGVTLTGYAVQDNGVVLSWRLGGPVNGDYQAFVHALGADGQRLTQADRLSWPGQYWRAGDTLALWFDLTLPPETAALYAGIYTIDGATYHNVAVIDAQGVYVDQAATIWLEN
jgi:hypothetical protein